MCSIEKDILDDINLDIVLEDFALSNAWRRVFIRSEALYLFKLIIIVIVSFFITLLLCFTSYTYTAK